MKEFGRYYTNLLNQFFATLLEFFRSIFSAIGKFFADGFGQMGKDFISVSSSFSIMDWLMAFAVLIANLVFFSILVYKVIKYLKKYVRFSKIEIEKENLIEEISSLNQKTIELIEEKNKILALKVSNLGINPDQEEFDVDSDNPEKNGKYANSRFVKLHQVDDAYHHEKVVSIMSEDHMINLKTMVNKFIDFSASKLNLYYDKKIISAFFSGLATSKTMILEGISGTGKTSLPYAMGKFFGNNASIIPVQPSWRDRAEMIGYLNEFTKKFNETDFLKAIYETTYRDDINIIVLDEMNLARVEYYFAELLSLLEMPDADQWLVDVVPDTKEGDPDHLFSGKILLPQNVWFVGTANKDDSTFLITDKVYDRAIPIEINSKSNFIDAPDTEGIKMSYEYLNQLFKMALHDNPISKHSTDRLEKLDNFITEKFKVTFGNRIMKQIKMFVPVYVACGGTEVEALDYMVARKILRKFESLNLPFMQEEIEELSKLMTKLFGKNEFVECQSYLTSIKRQF
ncbi:MAG: hypothetical protein JXC31_06000 [Acholeplasmataceae bacterium]|nr:hypothetical protein [Acholeplasmataceae bacterium]